MARAVELRGGREPRGTGADDRDFLSRPRRGRLGDDPAHLEALVDDRLLDVLDRDRLVVDAQNARPLARRGTDAPGELGEVVRLVEPLEGVMPLVAVDEVVPFGDQIVDRAARRHAAQKRPRMAERDAAIHAARTLLLESGFGEMVME